MRTLSNRTLMTFTPNRFADRAVALLLVLVLLCGALPSQQQPEYVLHVESDLVLVNVTVRDKNGKFVEGLKPEDFTILEDNKPQRVLSFDVENVDAVPPPDVTQAKPLPEQAPGEPRPPCGKRGSSVQRPASDCPVLRSLRHGTGRDRPRSHISRTLCRHANGP